MSAFTRRSTLVSSLALAGCAQVGGAAKIAPWRDDDSAAYPAFAAIEARVGGRVGVAALDTETGAWLMHRARERFAMCSTFKWMLAAAQLNMATHGGPPLNQPVPYDESDMLSYAPVARAHLERGWMTVQECCEAAAMLSDNTAANLLLEIQGGPEGFTRFLRSHGDAVTRLDRYEIELNDVAPGDGRDTTTPEAMARSVQRFLLTDDVLNQASRDLLIGWMVESPTGRERLRAGLPSDWRVGDKTGTWLSEHNATNDVAIAWPPGRAPIIIACYLAGSIVELDQRNAAHAEIAGIVATNWS